MLTWENVEISINKIDVDDVITTSYGTSDTPFAPPTMVGGDDEDKMSNAG